MEMRVLPHDLARVLGGNAMACRFASGEEGLVRLADAPFDPDSIAERRALDTQMGIVPLSREDISVLAFGLPVTVMGDAPAAVPGTMPVLVRLMTADELLEAHAEACRAVGQEPTMTREQAEELTRHL